MIEKLKQISYPTSNLFDNKRVAVLITAFDRPEMYIETVKSMNRCEELENIPIFIYLDGGNRAKIKEHIEISKNLVFKNKYVITRSVNYGCEKNVLNAFNDLFLELNFDYVMYVEDDNVFGKNYFKYLYDSYNKIKNEIDPNIGVFQGFHECFLSLEEKKARKDEYQQVECSHHWGFLLNRELFLKFSQAIPEYIRIIQDLPTNGMSNQGILANKVEIANMFDRLIDNAVVPVSENTKKRYYNKQIEHCTLGYDGVMELTLMTLGYKRYTPVVNRMINIGKYGIHFNEAIYKHLKLDKMTLDEVW